MSVYSSFMLTESDNYGSAPMDTGTHYAADVDSLVSADDVEKAWESNCHEMAARICAENTINFNNIMEACAIDEFCSFEESGVEAISEASAKGFVESVKNFFRKIWEKIQSIFKKVAMQFASWSKNDKEFYNKYKKEISKMSTSGVEGFSDAEVKVYEYPVFKGDFAGKVTQAIDGVTKNFTASSGPDVISSCETFITKYANSDKASSLKTTLDGLKAAGGDDYKQKVDEELRKFNEDATDAYNDLMDGVRAHFISSFDSKYTSKTCDAKDFLSEIAESCQGDTTKETKELGSIIDDALAELSGSDKIKSNLDKMLKAEKRSIDHVIKEVEKVNKVIGKDAIKLEPNNKLDNDNKHNGAIHRIVNWLIMCMKGIKNINVQFDAALLQHYKAYTRQCKAVCIKAATFVPKKGSVGESSAYQMESGISLLDNLELI